MYTYTVVTLACLIRWKQRPTEKSRAYVERTIWQPYFASFCEYNDTYWTLFGEYID